MKLTKLHVEAFGKLRNFDYEFTDGINVIKQPNGFGKTTLADFVCAMFYGLPDTRSRDLKENPRLRYRPWGSDMFGGWLTFEYNGETYRIERSFGKASGNGDVIKVYDEKTGKETDVLGEAGEELFKVDRNAFMRCIYMPQGGTEGLYSDDISRRLTETLTSSDEARYEEALARLDKERAFLYKTGDRGELGRLKKEYASACREEEEARAEMRGIEENTLLSEKLEERLKACEAEITQAEKDAVTEKKQKELREVRAALEAAEKKHEEIKALKIGKEADESELAVTEKEEARVKEEYAAEERKRSYRGIAKEYRFYTEEVEEKKKKAETYASRFLKMPDDAFFVKTKEYTDRENELNEKITQARSMAESARIQKEGLKKPEKPSSVMMVLFIVFACVSAAAGITMLIVPSLTEETAMIAVLAVLVIVTFVFGSLAIRKKAAYIGECANVEDLGRNCDSVAETAGLIARRHEEELEKEREKIRFFLGEYGVELTGSVNESVTAAVNNMEMLKMLKEDVRKAEERLSGFTPEVMEKVEMAESFSEERLNRLAEERDQLTERKMQLSRKIATASGVIRENAEGGEVLSEIKRRYEELMSETGEEEREKTIQPGEPEERKQALLKERTELVRKASEIRTLINEAKKRGGDLAVAEEKAEKLRNSIEEGEKKLGLIRLTMECLKKANETLSGNYLPGVRKNFRDFLAETGETDYPDVTVDADFKIRLAQLGMSRDIEYFSTGTKELMYFGLRLSLMQSMYGDTLPFIVIDDSLNNLDERRFDKISALLKKLSEKTQVIYLTCYREVT